MLGCTAVIQYNTPTSKTLPLPSGESRSFSFEQVSTGLHHLNEKFWSNGFYCLCCVSGQRLGADGESTGQMAAVPLGSL